MKPLGALWWLFPNGRPVPAKGARPPEVTAFAHEGDAAWTPIAAQVSHGATTPMAGASGRREVNTMFRTS
jgi:hypothetical protein